MYTKCEQQNATALWLRSTRIIMHKSEAFYSDVVQVQNRKKIWIKMQHLA